VISGTASTGKRNREYTPNAARAHVNIPIINLFLTEKRMILSSMIDSISNKMTYHSHIYAGKGMDMLIAKTSVTD